MLTQLSNEMSNEMIFLVLSSFLICFDLQGVIGGLQKQPFQKTIFLKKILSQKSKV